MIGSLAIWGPSTRLTRQRLAEHGQKLAKECQDIHNQ